VKKDLEYYMSLDYKIEINPIPPEDGGGYMATIPQLGKWAFVGDGDTIPEALKSLEEVKRSYFEDYIKNGTPIPEPKVKDDLEDYSGKFMVRVPKDLHRKLVKNAKLNDVSLNHYVCYLLTFSAEDMKVMVRPEDEYTIPKVKWPEEPPLDIFSEDVSELEGKYYKKAS